VTTVAVALVIGLLVLWMVQLVPAARYAATFRNSRPAQVLDRDLPKMCVHFPLRGADPHLAPALRSLLNQDYPDFELRVIIDSRDDPAWGLVEEILRQHQEESTSKGGCSGVHVTTLGEKRRTCSLIGSCLVQFVDELDDSCKLIAFADADMVIPLHWLREMASALVDPEIGTTLGNRWYAPSTAGWGTLVRYMWNAGAVVPMWLFDIPWSGASVMRLSEARRSGLAEKWGHGMVEDTPIKMAVQELGLKLKFMPQLLNVNREDIPLARCYQFIRRQMLWTRLYHPKWAWVVFNATLATFAMLGPVLFVPLALIMGEPTAAVLAAAGAIGYLAGMLSLLALLERAIRRLLRERGESLPGFTPAMLMRIVVGVPLTQCLYMAAVIDCMFMRRVDWRGVSYQVDGPWNVQMIDYQPMAVVQTGTEEKENMSL
jgi:hypothetical protein